MLEKILKYKDIVTTVIGVAQLIVGAVDQYLASLNGGEVNAVQLVIQVAIAIGMWFVGKRAASPK